MSETGLQEVARELEPETTVAARLMEHLWESRFALSVRATGAELLLAQRTPGDLVDEARQAPMAGAKLTNGDWHAGVHAETGQA